MKLISVLLYFLPLTLWAHEGHQDMPANAPPSGMSVYQLDSRWTEANGRSIRLSELKGTPRLTVMLYTRCQSSCPLIIEELKGVLAGLPEAQRNKVAVSLFSVDSEKETAESLQQFAKKRQLAANWRLFRGGPSEVSMLAAALGFRYKRTSNNEYVHSNVIYLLNDKGEVVAHMDGLKTARTAFVREIQTRL